MFPNLRFEIIDVERNRSLPINSTVFDEHPLNVCDTLETVKGIVSQAYQIPTEYVSLWDKSSSQFIGMRLMNCGEYSLDDACHRKVDVLFNDAKNNSISMNMYNEEDLSDDDDQDENSINDSFESPDEEVFGSFGSFATFGSFGSLGEDPETTFNTTHSNFLQENFMFDTTTTISSFLSIQRNGEQTHTLQLLLLNDSDMNEYSSKYQKGWINKYWGRATKRSTYQPLKRDIKKYFEIKQQISKIATTTKGSLIKERISIIDYKSKKAQHPVETKKRLSKYGEDIFESIELSKEAPFVSMKIPSLESHQFRMYVGDDSTLGVDDVDKFIDQTRKFNGLSLRMINPECVDSYILLDYRPEYSEITCTDEKGLFDSTVDREELYNSVDICKTVTSKTLSQSEHIYELFSNKINNDMRFDNVEPSELTKLTLKWKMYVPVSRVQDVIDKKLMGPLFKKKSLNTSQKKNKYISQNFLKFDFDPCIWSKMGNNLSTKICCTIRTTHSNSVIVTVQSTVLKRKVIEGKNRNSIDMYLTLWVYDILRTIILNKLISKNKNPQLSSILRLKDIDTYLFAGSVRNGGYTRKCLNFKDKRLANAMRFRQPMVIDIYCEEDMKLYRSLKHPGPIVKYRNNYYVGMRDELENYEKIEKFNSTVSSPKDTIEYFNRIIFFEIHEENYRAPNSKSGLIYPACVQRKDKLSKRHIDLMRQAFLETDEDKRIEIVAESEGATELTEQLKKHEFNRNCDVGYIMQASRTLPINSFGRLPGDGYGVYEWFRQNSVNFSEGKNEFLRKGTMHIDHFNLVHAVYDCTNNHGYRELRASKRVELVKEKCAKMSRHCSFGLFRTLHDGTLAQRTDYNSFVEQLKNPTSQLLHTEFSDLLSYCLSLNIIIFDCDTYTHSKNENDADQKKGYIAPSAKVYYTTLIYNTFIFLLKMRGTYEIIICYNGETHTSIFKRRDKIVQAILRLDNIHSSSNGLSKQLKNIHSEFEIVGQILNANNQCTHIVLGVSEVPIPVDGLCVPFKNDELRYTPILRYKPNELYETIGVMLYISIKFPEYAPINIVYDRRYNKSKNGYTDVVYALRLKNDLFCDVVETNLNSIEIPDGITAESNIHLSTPYYPDCINAMILGIQEPDERCYFMKTLNNVTHTFNFLLKTWHFLIQNANDSNFRNYIQQNWSMKNHERRTFLNDLICKLWDTTLSDGMLSSFNRHIMTQQSKELRFVLLNYFYRNPKFFSDPFNSERTKKSNVVVCESGLDVLKFGGVDPLRNYLKDCTRRQISHLHVTVKKQKRITYIPPTVSFVQLDVPLSDEEYIVPKYKIIGTILDATLDSKMLTNNRVNFQSKIIQWLNIFDRTRPVIGSEDITFEDLLYREDESSVCLALCVMLNYTISVIDIQNKTKCIYGSTLSQSEEDARIIYYLGERRFAKPENINNK